MFTAADTQSKAYVPATLALWVLPVYALYLDNLEPLVLEMDADQLAIATIATLLAIVLGAIMIRKLFTNDTPPPPPAAAADDAAPPANDDAAPPADDDAAPPADDDDADAH